MACETCDGTGRLDCTACSATGYRCIECRGRGWVDCPRCAEEAADAKADYLIEQRKERKYR